MKEDQSRCTLCEKLLNDDTETKWSNEAEPYCKGCLILENEDNFLANAFYDEDYVFIEHVTGKRPKNQEDAEQIIQEYKNKRLVD